ncbi:MAG: TIR domain-containing protein [Clostridia bacterium]|nr:TIR domain-containing protein [Clostridia bacterium]
MTAIRCKSCGGDLYTPGKGKVVTCAYCGLKQTLPRADNEKMLQMLDKANTLRRACEFDQAYDMYYNIISDFPDEAEAYWGLVLCRYGIEYVKDPKSGKQVPTCHRVSVNSLLEDVDFQDACSRTDGVTRKEYLEEADSIEKLREQILALSSRENPFDVFICYKETDDLNRRTPDSVQAYHAYEQLTAKGYQVFYARVTLESHLGESYEPYIYNALNTAKVMLVFGSKSEYINAVWVKNEWSRFLELRRKDRKRTLIVCYEQMSAESIPGPLQNMLRQDMSQNGAMQDLLRGIEKLLPRGEGMPAARVTVVDRNEINQKLQQGYHFAEQKQWDQAKEAFDEALDMDPRCGNAYLGLAMTAVRLPTLKAYADRYAEGKIDRKEINLQHAQEYADPPLREWMEKQLEGARKKRIREMYPLNPSVVDELRKGIQKKSRLPLDEGYRKIANLLEEIKSGRDRSDTLWKKQIQAEWEFPGMLGIYFLVGAILLAAFYRNNTMAVTLMLSLVGCSVYLTWEFFDLTEFLYFHGFIRFLVSVFILIPLLVLIPTFSTYSLTQTGTLLPGALVPVVLSAACILIAVIRLRKVLNGLEQAAVLHTGQADRLNSLDEQLREKIHQELSLSYRALYGDEDPEYADIDRERFVEKHADEVLLDVIGKDEAERIVTGFSAAQYTLKEVYRDHRMKRIAERVISVQPENPEIEKWIDHLHCLIKPSE